jgi:uncharacterized repeat protein (TIGR02543 family)
MNYMFDGCSSLTSLDVSGFDTSSVTSMDHMFSDYTASSALREITLGSSFVIPSGANGVFPTPTLTASGAKSSGTWGLASESADTTYTVDELATLGKTVGALAGTWYAQADAVTITFDANGGTGTMASQTLTADGAINPATFTRSGYYFTGWNTKSDGSGTAYADGATFTPTGSDITLYAQWTAGAELPEAGYPGDPTSKILGMCFALFGLILIAAFRDRDEK